MLLVGCTAIFAISIQSAQACKSINLVSARHYADIMFVGTPVKVSPLLASEGAAPTLGRNQKIYEFYFQINQVIKGRKLTEIAIRSSDHMCSAFYYIKKSSPSWSGNYVIYARKNKIGGYYETDVYFPNHLLPRRIDPRFPSVVWTSNPNRAAIALYWLSRRRSRYSWGSKSHVTQQIGMILPHKDGVLQPAQ